MQAVRAIIRAEVARLTYFGAYEYAIQNTDGTTIDCTPTDTTLSLPPLTKVPVLPGISGEAVTLTSGANGQKCVVIFLNADPSRPRVVSIDGSAVGVFQSIAWGGPAGIIPLQLSTLTGSSILKGI